MSRSIIHDDVFVARSVAPERPLCTIDGSPERLDRHGPLAAAMIADQRDTSIDLDNRRFVNEGGGLPKRCHTRLLSLSRAAHRCTSDITNKSITPFNVRRLAPGEQTELTSVATHPVVAIERASICPNGARSAFVAVP